MNCKPGDLAVIVKSLAGNDGKVVKCIKYIGIKKWSINGPDHTWVIDRELPDIGGSCSKFIEDRILRPIRDQPGTDETLLWAPVPKGKVKA